jgi:hypothetical protein
MINDRINAALQLEGLVYVAENRQAWLTIQKSARPYATVFALLEGMLKAARENPDLTAADRERITRAMVKATQLAKAAATGDILKAPVWTADMGVRKRR